MLIDCGIVLGIFDISFRLVALCLVFWVLPLGFFPKQCLHVEGSYLLCIVIAYESGIAGRRPRYLSLGT